jgi:diguanylate cyclase (GGDEF)-like protein
MDNMAGGTARRRLVSRRRRAAKSGETDPIAVRSFTNLRTLLRSDSRIRIWNSLFVRLFPYVVAIILLPVIGLTVYHLVAEYRFSEGVEINDSHSLSQKLAYEIDTYIRARSGGIRYLAMDLPVDSAAALGKSAFRESLLSWLADHLAVMRDVQSMFVLDRNGRCVVSTETGLVGRDFSMRSYARAALAGSTHVSDWSIGMVSGVAGIYTSAPVVRRNDIIGVAVVKISVAPIREFVAQSGGNGAALFLLNRDGIILTHTRPELALHSLWPLTPVQVKRLNDELQFAGRKIPSLGYEEWREPLQRAIQTGKAVSGRLQLGGQALLAVLAPCRVNNWSVGISKPLSLVHQKARRILGKGILVALLSLLLAVGIGFIIFFRVSRPLLELSHSVRQFSSSKRYVPTPVFGNDEIGVLAASFNDMAQTIQEQTETLERRVQERTLALEKANEEIRVLSVTDPLTRCFNRRYLDGRLPMEMARAARNQLPLSIMLLDLDHFKAVNDRWGHLAGDQVLREAAAFLLATVRSDIDWVVRFGGEELLMVLPDTPLPGAMRLAERIRAGLAEREIHWQDETIRVSASIGVTCLARIAPEKCPISDLLGKVDALLYAAKAGGRNRVCGEPLL